MYHIRIKSLRNYHAPLRVIAVLLFVLILLVAFRRNDQPTTLVQNAQTEQMDSSKGNYADYGIVLEDDFIVIYDGRRVVGTLSYRTSLGRMMMKDNENR